MGAPAIDNAYEEAVSLSHGQCDRVCRSGGPGQRPLFTESIPTMTQMAQPRGLVAQPW